MEGGSGSGVGVALGERQRERETEKGEREREQTRKPGKQQTRKHTGRQTTPQNTTTKNKRKTHTTHRKANNAADNQAGKKQTHTSAYTQANVHVRLQRVCAKKMKINNKPTRQKNPVNKTHTNKTRVFCVTKDDNGYLMFKLINNSGGVVYSENKID